LLVIDGVPAVSYSDSTNFGARFVRATDAAGGTWGAPMQVASGAFAASTSTSLAVVNGNPAIAFQRNNVKYSRALDAQGAAWSPFVSVGSTNMRNSINLLFSDGRPLVVARDPRIESVRADDANGDSWPTTANFVDNANRRVSAVDLGTSIAVTYTTSIDQLAYRRSGDSSGVSWGDEMLLDDDQLTCFQPSLAVVGGSPAVAYVKNSELRYIRASDALGAAWPASSTLTAAEATPNGATDLEVVSGQPAIAYSRFVGVDRQLMYVRATDATGASWGSAQTIDDSGSTGESLSLREVGGKPAIAYYDSLGGNLKYARQL
jgi:hypothetical protein